MILSLKLLFHWNIFLLLLSLFFIKNIFKFSSIFFPSFGPIPELLSQAEYVTKLYAICIQCGEHAHFTQRITNDNIQILVGETDKYEARCRKCFNIKGVS